MLFISGCDAPEVFDAVEEALHTVALFVEHGAVYLTPTEFKGKEDVVRNTLRFRVHPEGLAPRRRHDAPAAFVTQSSGSSDQPVRSVISLSWHVAETPAVAVFLEAHDLLTHRHAAYEPMAANVSGGIHFLLMLGRLGVPCERWFARPVPVNSWLGGA